MSNKIIEDLFQKLAIIEKETVPIPEHTDPNAILDCWEDIYGILLTLGKIHSERIIPDFSFFQNCKNFTYRKDGEEYVYNVDTRENYIKQYIVGGDIAKGCYAFNTWDWLYEPYEMYFTNNGYTMVITGDEDGCGNLKSVFFNLEEKYMVNTAIPTRSKDRFGKEVKIWK